MDTSLINLLTKDHSSEVTSLFETFLSKKALQKVQECKRVTGKMTYGTFLEYFGTDETPAFMDDTDNLYVDFFKHALQKFGVNGPQDFQDVKQKQQFFDYIDKNWQAQDFLTTNQQLPGSTQDAGTQTNLPQQAVQNQQKQDLPTNPSQGDDASVATMAPSGPSINQQQPLTKDGDDPSLDGKEIDNDPNSDDDLSNDDNLQNPQDDNSNLDSDFDDEDAYTVDQSDLDNDGKYNEPADYKKDVDNPDDSDDLSNDSNSSDDTNTEKDKDPSSNLSGNDDSSDDSDLSDDSDDDSKDKKDDDLSKKFKKIKEDFISDNVKDYLFIVEMDQLLKQAQEQLPTLEKEPEEHQQQSTQINNGSKKLKYVQKQLDQVKFHRNSLLTQLRRQRKAIKTDSTKSTEQKQIALKTLADMAKKNRDHFKNHAMEIKRMHFGGGN